MFSRFKFVYLLITLMAVMFLNPFVSAKMLNIQIMDLLLILMLVSSVFVAVEEKRLRIFVCIAAVGSLSTQLGWIFTGYDHSKTWLLLAYLISTLVFYGVIAIGLLKLLFKSNKAVSRDTLCCAASVYLMLGLIWAILYAILEFIHPGSYSFSTPTALGENNFDRFLGFSLTTLTTLGYGNIAPASRQADSLATLQAIIGQFYIAIVIARLVAMELMQKQPDHD